MNFVISAFLCTSTSRVRRMQCGAVGGGARIDLIEDLQYTSTCATSNIVILTLSTAYIMKP